MKRLKKYISRCLALYIALAAGMMLIPAQMTIADEAAAQFALPQSEDVEMVQENGNEEISSEPVPKEALAMPDPEETAQLNETESSVLEAESAEMEIIENEETAESASSPDFEEISVVITVPEPEETADFTPLPVSEDSPEFVSQSAQEDITESEAKEESEDEYYDEYLSAFEAVDPVFTSETPGSILTYPLPAEFRTVTSSFGMRDGEYAGFHTGIDISAPEGTPIYAAMEGEIIISGWGTSQGNYIVIDHGSGVFSEYHHMSVRHAIAGERVQAGQLIGRVGRTGYATGDHLHFMLMFSAHGYDINEAVDPYDYLYNTDTLAYINEVDFSSRRLITGQQYDLELNFSENLISEYRNIRMFQFEDEVMTRLAYLYFLKNAEFVEADNGIAIAEGEAAENVNTDNIMSESDNPLSQLQDALAEESFQACDIALIDTGAKGAASSISMTGEDADDDNGHGSRMLCYIKELAPQAKVLSIKALGADGKGDISAIYAAIEYAISQNVRIINLSVSALASADSIIIEDAVNEAADRGIIVIGAAGNNGKDASAYIPGGIESAIITGAATFEGERLASSNYGQTVDYNIVAGSTSEAAARLSGFICAHGIEGIAEVLDKRLIYSTGHNSTSALEEDREIVSSLADRKRIGEGELYPIGMMRSTVTIADNRIRSIDDLWSDYEGDGIFSNIDAFLGSNTAYVPLYATGLSADYFAARVNIPARYSGMTYTDMLAAHDNDFGELVDGVIYDASTGLAYVPAALIDFTSPEYRLNQLRIQLLYTADAAAITYDDGFIAASVSDANLDTGDDTWLVSNAPTVGSMVIVDTELEYGQGMHYGGYGWSDGVTQSTYIPVNIDSQQIAREVLTEAAGTLSNMITDIQWNEAINPALYLATWKVTLSGGTVTLSDGTRLTIPGGTYALLCQHIGVNLNFKIQDGYSASPAVAYKAGVSIKVAKVTDQYLYLALTTSTANNQAGCAFIKVNYQPTSGELRLQKKDGSGTKFGDEDFWNLGGALYHIYKNSNATGWTGYSFLTDRDGTGHLAKRVSIASTAESNDPLNEGSKVIKVDGQSFTTRPAGRYYDGCYYKQVGNFFYYTDLRPENTENMAARLPYGTYYVREASTTYYMKHELDTTIHKAVLAENKPVEYVRSTDERIEGGNLRIDKSVEYETGSITVKKTISSGQAGSSDRFTFRISVKNSKGGAEVNLNGNNSGVSFTDGVATFTLAADQSITFTGIPAGDTYTVEEIDIPEGYKCTSTNPQSGSVGTAPDESAFQFRVTLYGNAQMTSVAANINKTYGQMTFVNGIATVSLRRGNIRAEGLPAGLYYKVEEIDSRGYSSTVNEGSAVGEIEDGKEKYVSFKNIWTKTTSASSTVTFTNQSFGSLKLSKSVKEETSSLTIRKTVQNSYDADQKFEFRIILQKPDGSPDTRYKGKHNGVDFDEGAGVFALKDGEEITFTEIPAGDRYQVEEINIPKGYALQSANPQTGVLGAVARYDGTFAFQVEIYKDPEHNNRAADVAGAHGDMYFDQNGVATVKLHSGSVTATGIPAGYYYVIRETENHGYTFTPDSESGMISENAEVSASFSNSITGKNETLTFANIAEMDPVRIMLTKTDETETDMRLDVAADDEWQHSH